VPKHRRSEIEPSRASLRSRANLAESWPEAVGYGQASATVRPAAGRARAGHAGHGYRAPTSYDGAPEPDWEVAHEGHPWQEWAERQDWGPPPALHPDHPSAPVPRVQFSDDYPSRPMPVPRISGPPEPPQWWPDEPPRAWSAPPHTPEGYDNGDRWLYAVPDDAAFVDRGADRGHQYSGQPAADLAEPYWPETTGFHGPPSHEVDRFQQQPDPRWQETTDYRRGADPYGPDRELATGRFQNGHPPGSDSLWTAGQVLTLAEGRAAQIAQQAQDYAASIHEAAEREAAAITRQATGHAATMREAAERQAAEIRAAAEHQAAAITQHATGQAAEIREAAEREAAQLRARLDSMSGELGRVAAHVTERLAAPAMPAIAPALPASTPAPPDMSPALPTAVPTKPATRPTGPRTAPTGQPHKPGTKTAKPGSAPRPSTAMPGAAPDTKPGGPARQTTTPTKQGQAQGRQRRAMRIATAGTAALLSIAAIGSVTYTGIHGFSFFVFREGGQGETPGNFTDTKFLARQAVAQHHDSAPKGRHHKATGSQRPQQTGSSPTQSPS